MELSKEQQLWVDSCLSHSIDQYKQDNEGASPGGKWIAEKKRELELSVAPLSEIITRMVRIGDPASIHSNEIKRSEFKSLAAELDRRERSWVKDK